MASPSSVDDDDFTAAASENDDRQRYPSEDGDENGRLRDEELDDDLFGDGGDDEDAASPKARRKLDDEELNSGDDESAINPLLDDPDDTQPQEEEQQLSIMEAVLDRHGIPEPSDNELYLMKVPRFLGIQSKEWSLPSFQPPATDHHNKEGPSATFSAYKTAMTTIRWRYSPSNPTELQSNARILRWSDGSLTLQLASDPKTQYEIESKPLAPPQRNPRKATPTSLREYGKKKQTAGSGYNAAQDSFTYLVSPHESVQMLRVTNKVTIGLNILPTADTADDALERLQNSLAKAAARGREDESDGVLLLNFNEDPELAKRRAEAAEREKLRQQRAREKHELRDRERVGRAFGRAGGIRPSGLTIGGLEGDEIAGRKARAKARKPRRHEDWSDEEDYRRGKTREDEYDEEDDFIAASDEEEEVVEDDDEEEDFEDDLDQDSKHKGGDSPRKRGSEGGGDDDDAAANVSRVKRRRVVDEDDEDE